MDGELNDEKLKMLGKAKLLDESLDKAGSFVDKVGRIKELN